MGKTITAILIAAIAAAPGLISAQTHHSRNQFMSYGNHRPLHQPMMGLMSPTKYAAKTTATDVRLVSLGDMRYDGTAFVQTDSSTFSYSGTHGGIFDERMLWWNWNFDQNLAYNYNTSSSTYDPASIKFSYTYDANDNITTLLIQGWNSTTSAWDNGIKGTYTYSTSNNRLTALNQNWNNTTSAWDDQFRLTYSYTTANKLASYIHEDWNTTTSTWNNYDRMDFTWDASGNLIMENGKNWISSAWVDMSKYTYTYDGSGNRVTELYEALTVGGWDTTGKTVNSVFVGYHQPQTSVFMTLNTTTHLFEDYGRDNYTFNAYNKPDYHFNETWNATTSTWAPDTFSTATRYHYETYTPSGVETIAEQGVSAKIFPVPATNDLSIDAAWDVAQPFVVSITDMCGRTFTTWTVPAKKQYLETFSVRELPAGNYILSLQGDRGRVSKQFTIVR